MLPVCNPGRRFRHPFDSLGIPLGIMGATGRPHREAIRISIGFDTISEPPLGSFLSPDPRNPVLVLNLVSKTLFVSIFFFRNQDVCCPV